MSPTDPPFRSVFDCNVLLQAMANPNGPAGACLSAVRIGHVRLFLSRSILSEFVDVASRAALVRKPALSPVRTGAFIEVLTPVQLLQRVRKA